MSNNHTNRHRQQGGIRPEYETSGLVSTCPLTSLNPLDKHERRHVWDVKRAAARFFEGYIFDETDTEQ